MHGFIVGAANCYELSSTNVNLEPSTSNHTTDPRKRISKTAIPYPDTGPGTYPINLDRQSSKETDCHAC